ncbi:hypothetical protein ACFJGX_12665 [Hydrogenophaga sp. UC242_50]|uniref:hypothetical protein n=1 Tax=unclassified Hydrogenophaga TaxID=2610897 RepID=UPI0036D305FD
MSVFTGAWMRHGHDAVVHRHAVDLGAGQHRGGVDHADLHRIGGVGQVEHVHRAELRVDHEQALAGGVKGRNLRRAHTELARAVAADLLQLQAHRRGLGRRRGGRRGIAAATAGGEHGGHEQRGGEQAGGGGAGQQGAHSGGLDVVVENHGCRNRP